MLAEFLYNLQFFSNILQFQEFKILFWNLSEKNKSEKKNFEEVLILDYLRKRDRAFLSESNDML